MILKQVFVLLHGLINQVQYKLGDHGELLIGYVSWLRKRIIELRTVPGYMPVIHIDKDVYGTIGQVFGVNPIDAMGDYLARLAVAAHPFLLRIEASVTIDSRLNQLYVLKELTEWMDCRNLVSEMVVDE